MPSPTNPYGVNAIAQMSAEEMADAIPYYATGLRVALETKDITGSGAGYANHLAELASRAEAQFLVWKRERAAEKAR